MVLLVLHLQEHSLSGQWPKQKALSRSWLPTTINELVVRFSCDNVKKCMFGECEKCSSINVSPKDLNVDLVADSDSENSTPSVSDYDDNDQDATVAFCEWACEDTKLKKMLFKESIDRAIQKLKSTMTTLKDHIYVKRVQFNYYNNIKNKLGKSALLLHGDYSESYEKKQQHEIQSAYFGDTTFSIFTACCYLRDSEDNLVSESITVTSELPDHSRAAVITCVSKVIENVRENHQHLPLRINVYVCSDGCAAQFRSRYAFTLMSTLDTPLNLTLCCNERHHGKGPMDGIGGTLKNSIYWDVISRKCVIDTPKQFAKYAESAVKGITSLYLPTKEVLKEPDDIGNSLRITDTLQTHKVKRCFDIRKVCFLEFYNLATYNELFFTQFSTKEHVVIKTMLFVEITVDCAEKNICPTKICSSVQHVKYGLTESVFTCKNDKYYFSSNIFLCQLNFLLVLFFFLFFFFWNQSFC